MFALVAIEVRLRSGDTLPRDERALAYLPDSFNPIFAMSALGEDRTLFGFVAVSGRGRRFWSPSFLGAFRTLGIARGAFITFGPRLVASIISPRPGDAMFIEGVFVRREMVEYGIGTALLDAAISLAREERVDLVRVVLDEPSGSTRVVFEQRGFVPIYLGSVYKRHWTRGLQLSTVMQLDLNRDAATAEANEANS